MKKNKNKIWPILFALVLLLSLGGCGGGEGDKNGNNGEDIISSQDEVLVISDEIGFATVEIENGKATVFFHPEVWEEHEDQTLINETPEVYVPTEGPFPVVTKGGRVISGVLGQIEAMGGNFMSDEFVMPSLLLAMEDGSVEWLQLNPFVVYPGDTFESIETLPFIENIVSLSIGPDGEGIGETTAYAEDIDGLHYDLRLPYRYVNLLEGAWASSVELGNEEYHIYLLFGKNGLVKMGQSKAYSDDWAALYSGTYTLHLDEEASKGQRPGMLSLDLELDSGQRLHETQGAEFEIKGDFFLEMEAYQGLLELYHADKDPLLTADGESVDYASFWMDYNTGVPFGDRSILSTDFLTDEELVEYLLMYVKDAEVLVKDHGMATLVTGESSFISHEGMCREIWLGTDHSNNFVKEILYAVGAYGVIYEFHVPSDDWDMVFVPDYWDY